MPVAESSCEHANGLFAMLLWQHYMRKGAPQQCDPVNPEKESIIAPRVCPGNRRTVDLTCCYGLYRCADYRGRCAPRLSSRRSLSVFRSRIHNGRSGCHSTFGFAQKTRSALNLLRHFRCTLRSAALGGSQAFRLACASVCLLCGTSRGR